MKKTIQRPLLYTAVAGALLLTACQKTDNPGPDTQASDQEVLDQYANGVVLPNLQALRDKAQAMDQAINAFIDNRDSAHLADARTSWYETRTVWEQSEAMLFGPVEDNNFDPRIDTWPVDFNAIQQVWNSGDEFSEDYINALNDNLKGFHPIEFILFGQDGQAKPSDFTDQRQIDYLRAMSLNLKNIADSLDRDWEPAGGNFAHHILQAGTASSKYNTRQAAFIEIANAMIGIVDEVGSAKLKDPFDAHDPSQEESPFSQNSFVDFTNNITGAQNVYLGRFGSQDGKGLSDFVARYNKALDTKIQQQLQEAIANLGGYTIPYGVAIVDQRSQVQASMTLLETLRQTLEEELIPLIQLQVH